MNSIRLRYLLFIAFFCACTRKKDTLFTLVNSEKTGIDFVNRISDTDSLNILDYLYYYNGGGVAIADFNNDGLADIYFTSNQESNKLYLNKGNFSFEDITDKAGVQGKGNWKTGVTIADVNADGWLDIYVCEVGRYQRFQGRNELFINNHDLTFTERAKEYGLDEEGFNTQAVFFDYDRDNDLDMFLVNHSIHSTETYVKADARLVRNEVSGDKLFRNDGNYFNDVTEQAHIYSSVIGYGLNVATGDMNNDGWEDIYVSNDFHENDYYYVNQQNGTFKEMNAEAFGHESRFSMGSDIADVNNDGWLDIVTLDMLPTDEKILKASASDDPAEIFDYKLSYGYHYQYSRNCLQLNIGGGKKFSDIALYSGIAATDWSWSPLIADYDNDGIKDVFISNGILRRPNDMDYIKFISGKSANAEKKYDKEFLEKMPGGKTHNYIYKGTDSLRYIDKSVEWGLDIPAFSNGAAYADLDNDGDLDIVVNCINSKAMIYRNNISSHYLDVQLKGNSSNAFGIGAKVIIKQKDSLQTGYLAATKGFESSSLQYVHFGLGAATTIDTLQVIWPDGKMQSQYNVKADQRLLISYQPTSDYSIDTTKKLFSEIGTGYKHNENVFNDFNIQPLMPHKVSTQGPKMAVADINNDGLDDFFICGAKGQAGELYIQTSTGKFQSAFKTDSTIEEVNALFFDADGDNDKDLYVVSGGNEESNPDRLYLNDGKGSFSISHDFPLLEGNKSVAAAADFDKDGDMDLFVGGRVVAKRYGEVPRSYLLINNGKGKFSISPDINQIGMVTDAAWVNNELIVVGEWMPVTIFKYEKNKFSSRQLENTSGLWNTLQVTDINKDGYPDLLVGNLGTNSKYHADEKYPLQLYVDDFDKNGSLDQLLAIENGGKYYPFLGKDELEGQLTAVVKKKYLSYAKFAGQTIEDIFGDKLTAAKKYSATLLSSVVLINNKNGFTVSKLPAPAQWSPVYSFLTTDIDHDGTTDILAAGNFYGVLPFEGRYDASCGVVLLNKNGRYEAQSMLKTGFIIDGEVRDIKLIRTINNKSIIAVARNNDTIKFFDF